MRAFLIALCIVATTGYVVNVEVRLSRLRAAVLERNDMQTSWNSGGTRYTVTTHKEQGETLAEWQDRHFQAVRDAQAVNPPD